MQFEGPVGPWGWRLIDHQTAAASASMDFDLETPANSLCTRHMLICTEVILASDDISAFIRFSDDSLISFESGAGDYTWINHNGNVAAKTVDEESGGAIDTAIHLVPTAFATQIGNDTDEFSQWTIYIDGAMNAALVTHVSFFGTYMNDGKAFAEVWGAGQMDGIAAHEGVQFIAESGNITSGEFALFGLMLP